MPNKVKKDQKNFRLDGSVVKAFEEICKRKKVPQNEELESVLRQYIARDGEGFTDEIYAPWMENRVEKGMGKGIDRIAKMHSQTQITTAALLEAMPHIVMEFAKAMDKSFLNYLHPKLVNPDHVKISTAFTKDNHGDNMIQMLEQRGRTRLGIRRKELKKRKEEIQELFKNALSEAKSPEEIEAYNNKLDMILKKI